MYSLYLVKKYPPLVFLFICKSSLVSYLKKDIITVDAIYFYLFTLFMLYWDIQRIFTPAIIKLYSSFFLLEMMMCAMIISYYGTEDMNIVAYMIVTLLFGFSGLVSTYIQSYELLGIQRERTIELTRIEVQHIDFSTCLEKCCKPYDCTICLEPDTEGYKLATCTCDVMYHEICILTWLLEHASCPICRVSVYESV